MDKTIRLHQKYKKKSLLSIDLQVMFFPVHFAIIYSTAKGFRSEVFNSDERLLCDNGTSRPSTENHHHKH